MNCGLFRAKDYLWHIAVMGHDLGALAYWGMGVSIVGIVLFIAGQVLFQIGVQR